MIIKRSTSFRRDLLELLVTYEVMPGSEHELAEMLFRQIIDARKAAIHQHQKI